MKKIILLTMVLVGFLSFKAHAEEDILVPNKLCPISHQAVGAHGMTPHQVSYKGKTYNLCCSMCEGDFNKDPEKYIKMMEDELAAEDVAK